MQVRSRSALSRIELLVTIAVVGLLLAMLIPAVQQARVASRAEVCRNNLANVAIALLNHENAHGAFPGFINRFQIDQSESGFLENAAGQEIPVSWAVLLWSQLDKGDYLAKWKALDPAKIPAGDELSGLPSGKYPILICPSDRSTKGINANSYVLNTGLLDLLYSSDLAARPLDLPANGVFLDRFREPERTVSLSFIADHDGTAFTIMATENLNAADYRDIQEHQLGAVWRDAKMPDDPVPPEACHRINGPCGPDDTATDTARPSSGHAGGVNIAYCDRHVTFMSDKMDYLVYCQLMTPNGAAARQPDGDPLILDANDNGTPDLNEQHQRPVDVP